MIPGVSAPSRTGTAIRRILSAKTGNAAYAPGIVLGGGTRRGSPPPGRGVLG
jgi:hypothetical protein